MNVREIQAAITELSPSEMAILMEWLEEYRATEWDRQISQDAEAGRFDALRQRVREQRMAVNIVSCKAISTVILTGNKSHRNV